MYDIAEIHTTTTEVLAEAGTIPGYVAALQQQAAYLNSLVTTQQAVPAVAQPALGDFILYADGAWEGTFGVVLRVALADAFDADEMMTLIVWTRNEKRDTVGTRDAKYVKHVGKAYNDVLHDSDGNQCVRFYDGTLIDLDDIVAVSF
jgi:hypothetical protein